MQVTIKQEAWFLICIYKQPKANITTLYNCLDNVMYDCALDNPNIVIIGDINVNMLKDNQITDWLEINGVKNIIKEPTCFKGCPSLLDVKNTNKPKRFQNSVSVDTGLSDFHNMVCVSTKFHLPKQKGTNISYRSYKSFDRSNYLHDLSVASFHVADIFDVINDSYWFWNTMMRNITNEHAPVKTRT